MRYFVICDEESTLAGLRLAGMDGEVCHSKAEVRKSIDNVISDIDIGVLLISEKCTAMDSERIDSIKLDMARPLVVVIPGSEGTVREKDSITRLIREAIGIRI